MFRFVSGFGVRGSRFGSATLLIRLYELRRERARREARKWFARRFHPSSAHEIMQTIAGPYSAKFRWGNPAYLASLETVVMNRTGA